MQTGILAKKVARKLIEALEEMPCYTVVGADMDDDCTEETLCPACKGRELLRDLGIESS